jgi:hypothetical protein
VLDRHWRYLYVNSFVKTNLGKRGENLKGKNMWREFDVLGNDLSFLSLKHKAENGINSELTTYSPLTRQRLFIRGYVLKDCYLFTSTILPSKDELLTELRSTLKK